MSISTEIDKSRKLTVYTVTGQVSLDELLNSLEGFYESPEVTLNVLWDGRNAKLKPLSLVDITKIASYRGRHKDHRENRRGGKTAIVAPEHVDSGVFSMAEMFKKTMAAKLSYEVRAFRSIDDAVTWLGEA
jgi:hypothetical protein